MKNGKEGRASRVIWIVCDIMLLTLSYFSEIKGFTIGLVLSVTVHLYCFFFTIYRCRKAIREKLSRDAHYFDGYTDKDFARFANTVDYTFPQFGPRTDTKNMSRKELFRSGIQFLKLALLPLLIILTIAIVQVKLEFIPERIALMIGFISMILLLMCLAGGGYLIVRGSLRDEEPTSVISRPQRSRRTNPHHK